MDDASNLEILKYPIGRFKAPDDLSEQQRAKWISEVSQLPFDLSRALEDLSDWQLDTPYRPEGWSVRQLVHHIADSHMNSQIRFRWALTEDTPLIKTYNEKLWAQLPDARLLPVQVSVDLLDAMHYRWTELLKRMSESDFSLRLQHPVSGEMSLATMLALYAWHGKHHLAHIATWRARNDW